MLADESMIVKVDQVREYKGIAYRLLSNAMYEAVNLPENSLLGGLYTTSSALFAAIDKLELVGKLSSKAA